MSEKQMFKLQQDVGMIDWGYIPNAIYRLQPNIH